MTASEIIKTLMEDLGHTYKSLSITMGYPTPSCVSERLKPKSRGMTVSILLKFMEALDCDIIIRSRLKESKEFVLNEKEELPKDKPKIKDFEYDEVTDTWVRKKPFNTETTN